LFGGVLATEEMKFVNLHGICELLDRGEDIHIRQLSESEKARFEILLALHEVSAGIVSRLGRLLDVPDDVTCAQQATPADSDSATGGAAPAQVEG
jgi:hypothetical protein